MGSEVGDLFPNGILNQPEQVVEVEPEVNPGPPPNVKPNSRSSGEEDTDSESSDNCQSTTISSLLEVNWLDKPVPRPTGKWVDIYYYEKGKPDHLRSLAEVERYCDKHKIKFSPDLFDFKGSNLYTGPVPKVNADSDSDDSDSPCSVSRPATKAHQLARSRPATCAKRQRAKER